MTRIAMAGVNIVITLIIAAIAFAFTAVEYPATMRAMLAVARDVPDNFQRTGLSDTYLVWVDILLGGDKLVFMAYVAVTRVLLASFTTCCSAAGRRMFRRGDGDIYVSGSGR